MRTRLRSFFFDRRDLWKQIVKCTVAYEISFILILIPQVASNVGVVPYLVILGTLFFNPSSTVGNQIVEILLNILAAVPAMIWCGVVAYLCTLYNKARLDYGVALYENGAGVIASIGFFICVLVASYYRLKYPRLFIPMLQAFTVPFFGLTRNIYGTSYAVMDIVSIFYPVLIGGGVALLVNVVLWPETAAKASEKSLGNAIQSIRNVMTFVDSDLLNNDGKLAISCDVSASLQLRKLYDKLQLDIAGMRKAQQEAKYELVVSHYAPRWFKPLVRSIDDLSKTLYGFSLAIERELRIIISLRQTERTIQEQEDSPSPGESSSSTTDAPASSSHLHQRHQSAADKREHLTVFKQLNNRNQSRTHLSLQQGEGYKQLNRLQEIIQPSMKQFISCCIRLIDKIDRRLAEKKAIPFSPQRHTAQSGGTVEPDSTSLAGENDDTPFHHALDEFTDVSLRLEQDYEQGVSSPAEDQFLIYTILFTLCEFGKELQKLEQLVETLVQKRGSGRWPSLFFPKAPLSKWMSKAAEARHEPNDSWQGNVDTTLANESAVAPLQDFEATAGRETEKNEAKNVDEDDSDYEDASVPLQHAPRSHFWSRWLRGMVHWCRKGPTRYAIKFAITTELLAMMAWIPGANDLYNNNHGQWALLSAMVVFNYTVGSTALQCLFRVVATIIGAVTGYIALLAAHRNENPYVLAVMFLIFQVPFWYIMLGSKYPRIGFISLLTMAVISSTGYSDTLKEGLFSPVWKRTVTAIFAIIAVMLVNQLLWPVWARRVLREHLSDLLIATGIQYVKVASLVSQDSTSAPHYTATLKDCKRNEKLLTRQVRVTRQMLLLAADEPRITKGRFPIEVYREILHHELNILYWIKHLMIAQALISPLTRQKIMVPMNPYRKELAAAVHLYLFTLAGSLRTKSSLPASLPSAELPRRMLQKRQRQLWKENYESFCRLQPPGEAKRKSAENQVYWHTYADGSIEVIVEQESMGVLVARLMGQHVFKHWSHGGA